MLRNLPALLVGLVALVLGAVFSVVLLGVLAVLGLGVWAWLWWKTRTLRATMREAAGTMQQEAATGGHVIDGEAVVVTDHPIAPGSALPHVPERRD